MKSKTGLIFIITAAIFSFALFDDSRAQQADQTQEGIGSIEDLRELTQGNDLGANMTELAQQPANQSAQQPANQSAQQPANQSAQQPANQSAQQPANQSAQQPANQSAQQPANQSAQQPANQSAQQPANQSAQQPANFTQARDNIFETIIKYLQGNSTQN